MLERITHANGVVTYQSPLLRDIGVVHGFSTRIGGISDGPFASLNLGNATGAARQDVSWKIESNYQWLRQAMGYDSRMLHAWVTQVHGRRVELIEREGEGEYAETLEAEIQDRFNGQLSADGIVSAEPQVFLTVRVADCVPVLLAGEEGRVVAAVHAGWRGVMGNVVAKALRTMQEAAATLAAPAQICAAIGPGISVANFEVGAEVAEAFNRQGLESAVDHSLGVKPHIDLQRAIRMQLEEAGVTRVDGNNLCTYRDAGDFYSHRRDDGVTGRMAAAIACRAGGTRG